MSLENIRKRLLVFGRITHLTTPCTGYRRFVPEIAHGWCFVVQCLLKALERLKNHSKKLLAVLNEPRMTPIRQVQNVFNVYTMPCISSSKILCVNQHIFQILIIRKCFDNPGNGVARLSRAATFKLVKQTFTPARNHFSGGYPMKSDNVRIFSKRECIES